MRSATLLLSSLAFTAGLLPAFAQYPAKPVTMIVPWPPGGPSDIAARPLAKGMSESLGKPFVVENRGGASGNIGTQYVAKNAPADGYTVLVTSSSPIVINPSLYKSLPFDPAKDLQPITNVLRVPLVLAVHPSVPAKNLKELLAHIKSQGGKFQYASSGSGTPQHLTGELFRTVAKVDMVHVPYKGSAPALTDALGGHVPMIFDSTVAIVPHLKAGKLRPIAITSAKRSALLPDVPTFTEAGLPGVESYAWYGFFARAGTPKDVVARLNAEATKVLKGPDFVNVYKETGAEYVGDTPENFARFVSAEAAKWAKIVKESGATVD
ncbi:MAG TPA: tripartite tricarboxylate transporter substrate binding protein [Usitatibacter sp.]|nr:tripartite tricarboxylate transporter substrate binding protein [Usitatibacter sp.]